MSTSARAQHQLDLRQRIATLPKVELHVHLEGAVRPDTLRELARNSEPDEGLARWLANPATRAVMTFDELMAILARINGLLTTPAVYGRVTYELLADLASQNVLYAEIRMNPYRPMQRGLPLDEIVDAIRVARASAAADFSIDSGLIVGLNRNRGPDAAAAIVRQARDLPAEWICGFDLSDVETGWPPRLFHDVFVEVRRAGWSVTAHAGELAGAESVAEAIEELGAARIGHALSAAADPELLRSIRAQDIHLELCPGSNRQLGLIERLSDHPLPVFLEAGVSVSINSDDPAVFGATLTDELMLDLAAFDLSLDDAHRITLDAARQSFAPHATRERLRQRLTEAFDTPAEPCTRPSVPSRPAGLLTRERDSDSERRLDSLLRITRAVTSEIEIDALLRVVAEQTSRALDAERTTMFVLDRKSRELWSRVAEGLLRREIRLPCGHGLAGVVAASDRPLNIPDAYADPRFDQHWDDLTGYRTRSLLMHPLHDRDGGVIGVVQVVNKRSGTFDERDEDMLSGIAGAASAALVNAQHFEHMRRLTESALQTMGAMLDARDPSTAGHTRRVAETVELIGRCLGFSEARLAALRVAAAVHDYGKLSLPDALLNKPGSLDEGEFEVIRGHVEATRRILAKFAFPASLAAVPRIACEHHERMDGSGYPDGLCGDQISLEGRVLAVADVVDAMTSERPYRPALSLDEAIGYVVENRGLLFDARVVDALLEVFDRPEGPRS